jgi:hypothetical protein
MVRRDRIAMRYYVRALLGVAVFLTGIAGFCAGLFVLLRAVERARTPDLAGSGPLPVGRILALFFGGGLVALIGLAVVGWRGAPPVAQPGIKPNWLETLGLGLSSFGIFFLADATATLAATFGPGSSSASAVRTGMGLMGAVFAVMGIAPLALAIRWARADRRAPSAAEPSLTAAVVALRETAHLPARPPTTGALVQPAQGAAPPPNGAESSPATPVTTAPRESPADDLPQVPVAAPRAPAAPPAG